ncbi:MAG: gluconate 2-dehydrogenase subunit 3 family protein [Bryobacteraceae bacterium]|nr:gluconate 2-dehydrogenase subunit 3 family protein [Bryobacteraceae bacterium]
MGILDHFTRRQCFGLLLTPEIAAALQHAEHSQEAGAKLSWFDPATAAEVEALASRIVPSGDGPGAREAGTLYFIDRALATFDRAKQGVYKAGLAELQARRQRMFPGSSSIAALTGEQQTELLAAMETTEFFELLRFHTIVGMFAHPSWSGNRDQTGWKLIGFEDAHLFRPPFGYYDDPAHGEEER